MANPINHRPTREPQAMPSPTEALGLVGGRDNLILHGVIGPAAASELMRLTPDGLQAVLRYAFLRQSAQPAWTAWTKQLDTTANDQRLYDQQEQISAMWEVADTDAPDFFDFLEVQPLGQTLLIDQELDQARQGALLLKEATTQARDAAYHAGAAEGCPWTPPNEAYRTEDIEAHARAVCRGAGYGLRDSYLPEAQAIYWVAVAAHTRN